MPLSPPTAKRTPKRVKPSPQARTFNYGKFANRGTSSSRGYGHKWRLARAAHLADSPLCVSCAVAGLTVPATEVDHITPHRGDMTLFWDVDNWQSLCKPCHSKKTASGK